MAVFLVFTMLLHPLSIPYTSSGPLWESFLKADSSSYFWVLRVSIYESFHTTTFLKPSDANDMDRITSLQCTSFCLCIIYSFNDLIHWKDKPLERWQLFLFTIIMDYCMALFSHNDCIVSLSTCASTLLSYITSIYHSS